MDGGGGGVYFPVVQDEWKFIKYIIRKPNIQGYIYGMTKVDLLVGTTVFVHKLMDGTKVLIIDNDRIRHRTKRGPIFIIS